MNTENHIPDDDLILFALQLLPEDRMSQTRQHAANCDLCRSEIARLQGDLATYSLTADPQTPPPSARERFLRQISREPRLAPPEPDSEPVIVRMPERRSTDRRAADRLPETRLPETRLPETRLPETRLPDSRQPDPRGLEMRAAEARLSSLAGDEPLIATRQSRGRRDVEEEDEVAPRPERRRPSPLAWVLAGTGWAIAAGASFVAGLQVHQRQQIQNSIADQQARFAEIQRKEAWAQDALSTLTASNAMQMPLHPTAAVKPATAEKSTTPTPEALAAYLADKGALVFIARHMDPAPDGKTYELWLLPTNGNPIAAGTFKPDPKGTASVVMPQIPKGVQAKGFGVTVENDGGSDVPTSPVIMAAS